MYNQANALLSWTFVGLLAVAAIAGFVMGSPIWSLFTICIAVAISLSAVSLRGWTALTPWPLVALSSCATFAVLVGLYRELAVYLTFVAVALVFVIQLLVFTDAGLSGRFAIFFAVLVTMSLEAVWIVAQSASDTFLGTGLIESRVQLQWQIVHVTGIAVVVGILYRMLGPCLDARISTFYRLKYPTLAVSGSN